MSESLNYSFWNLIALMHLLRSEKFLKAYQSLCTLHQCLTIFSAADRVNMPESDRIEYEENLEILKNELEKIELDSCAVVAERALEIIRYNYSRKVEGNEVQATFEYGESLKLNNYLPQLTSRIVDDFRGICVLVLPQSKAKQYKAGAEFFGKTVQLNFTDAAYDLEEAVKCLALRRATATVFHLMRSLEVAIRLMAHSLSIPDPIKAANNNWGKILNSIKSEITGRDKKDWSQKGDKEFYEGAHATLDSIRVAWRNPTMHVENTYTIEEAEHLLHLAKGLLTHLAKRLCGEEAA